MSRRPKPKNRLAPHTSALHSFLAGAVVIVSFLFQSNLLIRACQVGVFGLMAHLSGKRIKPLYFLIMVASITFFNALSPVGEVLVEIGRFSLTRGALEQGLLKGLAIVGLVFVSLFAVRPELRLPGSFGGMIARVFYYFEEILDMRKRVRARQLVESIDEILMELYPESADHEVTGTATRTDMIGALVLLAVVASNVGLAVVY